MKKKPTVRELLDRVEALEARIRELESRPAVEHHTHHHWPAPQPQYVEPTTIPYTPVWPWPTVVCNTDNTAGGNG